MSTPEITASGKKTSAIDADREPLTLSSLAPLLHCPFVPERIGFLPKDPREDKEGKTKCKIFPIAEVWDYVLFLTTHAFGNWSVSDVRIHTFDDRLVVVLKVTICGVSMWGVGEEMLKGKTGFVDENATTSAWAQAFKRACSYFGLGLYFYFMKRPRDVAYDPVNKRIDASQEELQRLVAQMYADAERKGWLHLSYGSPATDILSLRGYLAEPFPYQMVDFLAHSVKTESGGAKTCTAVPFVKVWYYIYKLNTAAYGQWYIEEEPIITSTNLKVMVSLKLTVFGHSMIGIGEEFWTETRWDKGGKSISVPRENAVENAWAQAVKRCLQALGLGLDLRFLPDREGVSYEYGRVASAEVLAQELYHAAGLLAATEKQITSLRKLCDILGKEMPEQTSLSSKEAKSLITQLTAEYKSRHVTSTPTSPGTSPDAFAAQESELRVNKGQLIQIRRQTGLESTLLKKYRIDQLEQLSFSQASAELTALAGRKTATGATPSTTTHRL